MGISILAGDGEEREVGSTWTMLIITTDAEEPTVTITLPAGTTTPAQVEDIGAGYFTASYTTVAAGRHLARVVTTVIPGQITATHYASAVTSNADFPDVDSFKVYARMDLDDTSADDEIEDALAAESRAQRNVCRIPAAYPDDLREALHRRVARNLAMRGIPLAVLRGDGESGSDTVLPGKDPEVRRLEKPYPKLVMG